MEDSLVAQAAPFMRVTGWFWNGAGVVGIQRQHDTTSHYKMNMYAERDTFKVVKSLEVE